MNAMSTTEIMIDMDVFDKVLYFKEGKIFTDKKECLKSFIALCEFIEIITIFDKVYIPYFSFRKYNDKAQVRWFSAKMIEDFEELITPFGHELSSLPELYEYILKDKRFPLVYAASNDEDVYFSRIGLNPRERQYIDLQDVLQSLILTADMWHDINNDPYNYSLVLFEIYESLTNANYIPCHSTINQYYSHDNTLSRIRPVKSLLNSYLSLTEAYKEYNKDLLDDSGIIGITLPPVVAVVLSSAQKAGVSNFENLWEVVLEWRNNFKPYREKIAEIRELATEGDIIKHSKERKKIINATYKMIESLSNNPPNIVPGVRMVEIGSELLKMDPTKLINLGIEKLYYLINKSIIKPLPHLSKVVKNITKHQLLIERFLGFPLDESDIRMLQVEMEQSYLSINGVINKALPIGGQTSNNSNF